MTGATQGPALHQEDPLEEGMAAHARILAWRVPRTEEPGGLQSSGPVRAQASALWTAELVRLCCERQPGGTKASENSRKKQQLWEAPTERHQRPAPAQF